MLETLQKEAKPFHKYASHVYLPKRFEGKQILIVCLGG